jgi:hypothetical protein
LNLELEVGANVVELLGRNEKKNWSQLKNTVILGRSLFVFVKKSCFKVICLDETLNKLA